MEKIDLFIVDEQGSSILKKGGLFVKNSDRDLFDRSHVFEINLAPKSKVEIYLCFTNTGRMFLPISLWTPKHYFKKANIEQIILGVFYGMAIAIFIYSIFISISLKENAYFRYAVYLVFLVLPAKEYFYFALLNEM